MWLADLTTEITTKKIFDGYRLSRLLSIGAKNFSREYQLSDLLVYLTTEITFKIF